MVTKTAPKEKKEKAVRLNIGTLVVIGVYERTFSTGKKGFFGKVIDPQTGDRYQVIGAVKIEKK